MLRRQLIELGAGVAVGAPAAKLAQLLERLELGDPSPVPLPSQLGAVHVAKVRDLTRAAWRSTPCLRPGPGGMQRGGRLGEQAAGRAGRRAG